MITHVLWTFHMTLESNFPFYYFNIDITVDITVMLFYTKVKNIAYI